MPSFKSSDGLNLHYEDEGEGIPLLCLSGLTRNARDFDYVAPHLGGFRVIRLDYRGRGLSDWADSDTYTPMTEARDAFELLDHLRVDQAAVLGTSRGGLIALVMVAVAPQRVLGVAFNDVGPVVEPGGLAGIMTYLGRNPPQVTFDEAARARADLPGFPGVPFDRWRKDVTHTAYETDQGLEINYDPGLRDAVAAAMEQPAPDLWPLFDKLADVPVAVIRGANSDLLSAATLDEMSRRHPELIAAVVPDRGHIPFLDEPEALKALDRWKRRLT